MKKLTLICIVPAVVAILSSCTTEVKEPATTSTTTTTHETVTQPVPTSTSTTTIRQTGRTGGY